MKNKTKAKRARIPRALANRLSRISAYSLVLVVMTFLGLYAGLWLDRITGMAPNFTLLLLIIGIVIGFKGFIEEVVLERRAKT